ncbi:uncharacterized protein [Atheta coriaria]|uniref:uncharacterized protein n=1 Tax=Dalotia coriaria TaxID=877792 RepID=UPI0031F42034
MSYLNVIVLALATIAIAQINAIPVYQDTNGNEYYLVPVAAVQSQDHHRHVRSANPQRETTYDIGNKHVGLGQKYTFVDNDKHQFSANAYGGRDFAPKGPLTTGQGAEYLHKPSGSNFQVNAENTRGAGTDFKASGTYNFFQTQDKRGRVGVAGEYERHYGGRGGTTDPKYNVLLKGSYDF